ncbi:MAG TPA: amidohydrolase [Opitutaceae bacterium]|nr:amidohydrolase [Opitutaceae bacterium]
MSIPIIDTHQHLWDPTRFSYSWMADQPSIRRRSLVSEYREATAGFDIVRTVYVDTDVDVHDLAGEVRFIFELADDPANRIDGVVPGAKLENPEAFLPLQPFLNHPKLKGVRRILQSEPDSVSEQPQFVSNVQALAQYGLSFDLCVRARQLPLARKLVQRCPDVHFILDHCGVPDIKGGGLDPWRSEVKAIAAEPNVSCKLSGLVAYVDPHRWTDRDLRPYTDHVLDCFGWDRVMWGGDWPVCTLTCPLSTWIETALRLTENASAAQRDQLFRRNAERIYRLSPPS